ncbi:LPS assembly lipoprotein LptE [Candidatus Magnetaquicoccus inordinatus]|uniref:LPS assembly lipoprotein LptE n=1 Tax=Candidatus Magnetaquicoccus inordinatus TaxID=2496818 RepID=UPI00187D4C89|nr:LPS assembly lipoprotein LptE [Candidatus Magnetaquicoccus inordinatus]
MNALLHLRRLFSLSHLLILALLFLPACGYRLPGSAVEQAESRWQNSSLQISGKGAEQNPQLVYFLRERLQARLGLQGAVSGQEKETTVKITLSTIERALVTEDRSGRANLFRISVNARLHIEGDSQAPKFPSAIHGSATYYEPFISTAVQATRKRAETEAVEQLADTLITLLSSTWPDHP